VINNVFVFDSFLEFGDEGFVDAYDPCFLPLAEKVDLPKMKFNVFGFEIAEFGASESCVDQKSYDEAEISMKKVLKILYRFEELFEFVWIEAPWDSVLGFAEKFDLTRRVFFDVALIDCNVQIFPESFKVLVDCCVSDSFLPVCPEFFNMLGRDVAKGSVFEGFV